MAKINTATGENEDCLAPFKDYLLRNKQNRTILWIAAAAMVVQFSIFKGSVK